MEAVGGDSKSNDKSGEKIGGFDLGLLKATMVLIAELVQVVLTGSEGRYVNWYN